MSDFRPGRFHPLGYWGRFRNTAAMLDNHFVNPRLFLAVFKTSAGLTLLFPIDETTFTYCIWQI